MKQRVVIVSMGCSKNLVDSERLASRLGAAGFEVAFDSEDYRDAIVVVNTCGFINDAKEESIEMLLNAVKLRQQGDIKAVYAMGCLTERYRADIASSIPELDGIFGKFDWTALIDELSSRKKVPELKPWARQLSTAPHYTYIKIAEGCNRFCAFCAIPLITGRYKSRPIDEIVEEVTELAGRGVKEFNIIAQDLSAYGTDFETGRAEEPSPLALLLERLAAIEGVEMLRLHYAYPSDFPYDILPVMARHANICKYLDIALQHIDDTVLSNMRRHINADETRKLLRRIRAEVPDIHIRTTLMVGFPGEDDAAFGRLLDFVAEQRFERMGAFAYCQEDDTYAAAHFADSIPEEVKQERLDRLMELQHSIAEEHAASKIGQVLRVIVDEKEDDGHYTGRTEYDSPEVDCNVFITSAKPLETGGIYNVEITGSEEYDLTGKAI